MTHHGSAGCSLIFRLFTETSWCDLETTIESSPIQRVGAKSHISTEASLTTPAVVVPFDASLARAFSINIQSVSAQTSQHIPAAYSRFAQQVSGKVLSFFQLLCFHLSRLYVFLLVTRFLYLQYHPQLLLTGWLLLELSLLVYLYHTGTS